MPHRVCVLFDAHTFDPFTMVNLERMRAECAGVADVHLIYSGAQPLPDSMAEAPWVHVWDRIEGICGGPKTIPYSREEVESTPMILAMNSEVKTLNFATAAGVDYDLIIRIEFDVWSPLHYGEIVKLVVAAARGRAYVCFYLRGRASDPDWYWWHEPLEWPDGLTVPNIAGLTCLFAITVEAAQAVAGIYARGVAGHQEITLPGAVLAAGYDQSDLGTLERVFCNGAQAASTEPRYQGPFQPFAAEFAAGCHLFHSVKTMAQAARLRALHSHALLLSGGGGRDEHASRGAHGPPRE